MRKLSPLAPLTRVNGLKWIIPLVFRALWEQIHQFESRPIAFLVVGTLLSLVTAALRAAGARA